jgi:hypothetical protein
MSAKTNESIIASQCFIWAWNNYPSTRYCLFHIANEAKRSIIDASKQKAMGLLSGVPDYGFVWKGNTYYFELKTEEGKVSENQKKVHNAFENQGVNVTVGHSFEDFKSWFLKIY